ncbi:MAG: hypothetical protein A2X05_08955 [Bacteroidetes bacterium GWE2_41_25]|nr:MAG: hypothetical protein A2X03_04660 [Bacteroidetes bacterium GWA2_40_15]OFX87923.1 MAG: hypothetical protein A2X06_08470 [Bacteroidetes bacterium GWC2_40_22]OFY05411.1 MAG: hypothetical protein A2X05_08955 [Bacteroidetes bacterium GWE2_41_25]OFY59906.1 MAG: hypothetical protein A2X04_02080 [Bacteroidetes bacterium GWF2_41_9]HAM10545.1 hypothetical protein [Bacteroidales bacterium]
MKTGNAIFMGLMVFIISCAPEEVNIRKEKPVISVIPAKGYVVPDELVEPPLKIVAGKPYTTRVNTKNEIKGDINIEPVGPPQILRMKPPVVKTPGKDGIKLPEIIKVNEICVLSRAPEIVQAKTAHSKEINPMNFSSLSKIQGLRHDQIRNMAQDKAGNIWLGTDDGLTKYDGKYFSHYTTEQGLNNNLILSVCIDINENLWIGSFGGGAIRYDGLNLCKFTDSSGLVNNVVNCIFEDSKGKIWLGTAGGLSVYSGRTFTNYTVDQGLCHNYIRSIAEDNSGRIWISTNDAGISVFDGRSFSNYSESEGLPVNHIHSLYKDKDGNIWLGGNRQMLMAFNGSDFISFGQNYSSSPGYDMVRTMIQDSSGNLWIGTEQGGISVFNGKYLINYTEKDGLASNMIRSSLLDRNGNLWFGTRGGGLIKYEGTLFTHLTINEGLSNSMVMSIMENEPGDIWLGTFGGYVTRVFIREENGIEQKRFVYYDEKDGFRNNRIYSILKTRNKDIWFGTDGGGVSVFDGKYMKTFTRKHGLCSDTIRKIIEDKDGNIWFASYSAGLSKYDGTYFYNYSWKQGISSNNILSLFEDSEGRIWIASATAGICMIEKEKVTHYSTKQGFINDIVYCIIQVRDGSMWFGTGGSGVVRYDGTNFISYSGRDFETDRDVLSIYQDSKDNIWLGTRFGPVIIDAVSPDSGAIGSSAPRFKHYGYEDGFTGIGCNFGAITETKDGTVWIGANDRLTAYNSKGERKDFSPLTIQLTGIKLFNEDMQWTGLTGRKDTPVLLHNGVEVGNIRFTGISKWSLLPENLSLRYNNNYLTFDYIAVSVTGSSKIRYQYMLEGFDDNWNLPTERTEVSFGKLDHRDYVFKVKTMDIDGRFSNVISFPFTIRPPWFQTLFFYIISGLLILVSIFGFIKYRFRKLESDKRILQEKVEKQTVEIIRKNTVLTEQKNEILEKNTAIEKTNQELVRINSEKDKFFSILAHDLRGPFSSIMMLTEEMAAEMPNLNREEINEIIKVLQSSSASLFRLLENLLNWARMKQGHIPFNPEKIKLSALVGESLSLLVEQAKAKKIEVTCIIPDEITVFGDKNMLQSVLRNLVSNSVKFTRPGGKIDIFASINRNDQIEIAVQDNGIGMNRELLQKLFHLDEKTNRPGTEGEISTGLGLLLCKDFVEKHNGRLWVESEKDKGSVFYISIPAADV